MCSSAPKVWSTVLTSKTRRARREAATSITEPWFRVLADLSDRLRSLERIEGRSNPRFARHAEMMRASDAAPSICRQPLSYEITCACRLFVERVRLSESDLVIERFHGLFRV